MLISCVYNSVRERYLRHIYRGLSCVLFWFLCAAWRVIVDRTTSDICKQQFCCRRRWWGVFSFGNFFLDLLEFSIFVCVFICVLQWRQRQKCQNDTRACMCRTDDVMRAARGNFSFKYLSNTRRRCSSLSRLGFHLPSRHSHQAFWEVFTLLAIDDHSRLSIQIRNEFNKLLYIFLLSSSSPLYFQWTAMTWFFECVDRVHSCRKQHKDERCDRYIYLYFGKSTA